MNKKTIIEYSITFLVTLVVAIAAVGFAVYGVQNTAKQIVLKRPKAQAVRDDKSILVELIAQNEKAAIKDPADYKINTRLGNLYQILGIDKDAEKNFHNAMAKSPYGVYSTYFDLGAFYIHKGNLSKAESTIKEIKNKNNKAVQTAKGDFYINLGDAHSDFHDYEMAQSSYEKALSLYEFSKKKSRQKIARERIVENFDNLANKNLEKRKLYTAINNLENSLKYKDTAIVNYKLAILYMDVDPVKAYNYIKKTEEADPGIINYTIYEKILAENVDYYKEQNLAIEEALFKNKIKTAKKFRDRYIIKEGDFTIDIISCSLRNHYFGDGKTVTIKFRVKNNTYRNINHLFLKIDAINNDENETIFDRHLFTRQKPLKAVNESREIKIKYSFNDPISAEYSSKLTLNFRATKRPSVRTMPLYTLEIAK